MTPINSTKVTNAADVLRELVSRGYDPQAAERVVAERYGLTTSEIHKLRTLRKREET